MKERIIVGELEREDNTVAPTAEMERAEMESFQFIINVVFTIEDRGNR